MQEAWVQSLVREVLHATWCAAHLPAKCGLPWWLSGKESACQCRRCRFDPWSRKTPQAAGQLSQRTTTIDPVLLSPGATTTEARMP